MVGEVVERSWVGWVLRRMRMAMDDKVSFEDSVVWSAKYSDLDVLVKAEAMDRAEGRNRLLITTGVSS